MFINNSLVSCWGHREQGGNGPRSYHVLGMVSDLWPWEVSQHSAFLIVTHPLPLESGGGGRVGHVIKAGAWAGAGAQIRRLKGRERS